MDRLLDTQEAATFLNLPVTKIRSLVRLHQIPNLKIGRYVRYDKQKLEEWLTTLERGNGACDDS